MTFKPFPYSVVLDKEQMRTHMDAASAVAMKLGEQLRGLGPWTPYDVALGLYLLLAGICDVHGWDPRSFHQWVADKFPKDEETPTVGGTAKA